MLCIKNGTIHDAVHREAYVADILVENGKFADRRKSGGGGNDRCLRPERPSWLCGTRTANIGLDGYGEPGVDYNEMNDICRPQLRAIDGVDPMDHSF